MKHCANCDIDVDNSFNLCPYCGQALSISGQAGGTSGTASSGPSNRSSGSATHRATNSTIPFQTEEGNHIVFNGQIVESGTQQYYQSKLTKVIQAIFHGEPYQLSHTTFVTVFRIEEHVQRGFAERARDIVVYGQLQNVLSPGDDVTVVAQPAGDRLVARSIINHSSETQIVPQGGTISAGVVRAAVLVPLAIILLMLIAVASTPADVLVGTVLNVCWPLILIGLGIAWVRNKFKKK